MAAKCKKSESEGARVALCCSLAFTGRERGERLVSVLDARSRCRFWLAFV